ncbi:MAG: hypothetical protein ACRD0Z_13230 [Acidimicrobiales bacterium]
MTLNRAAKQPSSPDALDVLQEEGEFLAGLFRRWNGTEPVQGSPDDRIQATWDHGTIGKLLLERGAVYVAACDDAVRVLREIGQSALAGELTEKTDVARRLLDELDEQSRGVGAMSLATPSFEEVVDHFHQQFAAELQPSFAPDKRLATALGVGRARLRSARFLQKHAPTHPGPRRWYSSIPPLVRAQAIYDRARGCPWANSPTFADSRLTRRLLRNR